jgi:A/G-specific adenine glycosylase
MARRSNSKTPLLSSSDWRRLRAWFRVHSRRLPWRHNTNPWRILLAETLLHRTNARLIEVLYPVALREFPSPKAIVGKKKHWIKIAHRAGLAWRARKFISACEVLVNEYGERVPSDRAELQSLPGLGHYTASAVRCFGFGYAEHITDTNTIRLAGRIAGMSVNPADHRAKIVQNLTARLGEYGLPLRAKDNYALLDLAAIVCRPTTPLCCECPVRSRCSMGRTQEKKRSKDQ